MAGEKKPGRIESITLFYAKKREKITPSFPD